MFCVAPRDSLTSHGETQRRSDKRKKRAAYHPSDYVIFANGPQISQLKRVHDLRVFNRINVLLMGLSEHCRLRLSGRLVRDVPSEYYDKAKRQTCIGVAYLDAGT